METLKELDLQERRWQGGALDVTLPVETSQFSGTNLFSNFFFFWWLSHSKWSDVSGGTIEISCRRAVLEFAQLLAFLLDLEA